MNMLKAIQHIYSKYAHEVYVSNRGLQLALAIKAFVTLNMLNILVNQLPPILSLNIKMV